MHWVCPRFIQILVRDQFQQISAFTNMIMQRWIQCATLMGPQFLSRYSICGMTVDGLFVWLGTVACKRHLNFVHSNGVWTTHSSEHPDLRDATVCFLEHYFHSTKSLLPALTKAVMKGCLCDPWDTGPKYELHPTVLNKPMQSVESRMKEIDIILVGLQQPIQCLLAQLFSMKPIKYYLMMVGWIREHEANLHCAQDLVQSKRSDITGL